MDRIRNMIARLRAEVWAQRSEAEKNSGCGWVCLDYAKMNRIEELREELEGLESAKGAGPRAKAD